MVVIIFALFFYMNERLDSEQKQTLIEFIESIPVSTDGGVEITLPYGEGSLTSLIAMTFIKAFDQGGRGNRDLNRKLSGPLINNPSGSRQQREEAQGFEHHRGYRATGRNHSGRERSINRTL